MPEKKKTHTHKLLMIVAHNHNANYNNSIYYDTVHLLVGLMIKIAIIKTH